MGDINVIKSYLVRLGWSIDETGYSKFAGFVGKAASLIDSTALRMAGWETAAIAAFASIGTATAAIADKVAMADQEYRLLGLHMFTNTQTAREFKIAMDALGQPLENIAWDPELSRRFQVLIEDQRRMTRELGTGFEKDMYRLRDFRFEFSRFEVELKFFAMMVVDDLAKAFGVTGDTILARMRKLNDYFISNMPRIAAILTTRLVPVLKQVRAIMKESWKAAMLFGQTFANLVGLLSGDHSLEGTAANFDKISRAISVTVQWLGKFLLGLLHGEELLAHLFNAAIFAAGGKFSLAAQQLRDAGKLFGPHSGAAIGAVAGGMIAGPLGAAVGGVIGYGAGDVKRQWGTAEIEKTKQSIASAAQSMGLDPALALAVAYRESGFHQFDARGNVLRSGAPNSHATGLFQIQPGTARAMGYDPSLLNNPLWNTIIGLKYLKSLMARYGGNEREALEHYYGSRSPTANEAYANRVMQAQAGVNINTLVINIPAESHASRAAIISATTQGIADAAKRTAQRNTAYSQAISWNYGG